MADFIWFGFITIVASGLASVTALVTNRHPGSVPLRWPFDIQTINAPSVFGHVQQLANIFVVHQQVCELQVHVVQIRQAIVVLLFAPKPNVRVIADDLRQRRLRFTVARFCLHLLGAGQSIFDFFRKVDFGVDGGFLKG